MLLVGRSGFSEPDSALDCALSEKEDAAGMLDVLLAFLVYLLYSPSVLQTIRGRAWTVCSLLD